MHLPNSKLLSLADAVAWRQKLRTQGKRLMMTNGGFDILHVGHLSYLQAARQKADALIVALNSDESVKMSKGPLRPINDEQCRAYALAACHFVDAIVIFGSKRLDGEIRALQPDIYCKGADYKLETLAIEERTALEEVKAQIVFLPFLEGFSTTLLIKKIHEAAAL